MKMTAVWTLVAVNVVLLLMFLLRMGGASPAAAQAGPGPAAGANALAARPGDYLMLPGEVINGNDSVVYVLDQTNHLLSAMVYDDTSGNLATMAPVSLDRLFTQNRNQNGGLNAP